MHKIMKHRISQVDGINDSVSHDFTEDDINFVSKIYMISVKENNPLK